MGPRKFAMQLMHVRDDDNDKYLYSSVVYREGRDMFYLRCVCEEQQITRGLDVDALLPKVGAAQQGEESLAAGALGGPPLMIDPEQAYPPFDPEHVTQWVSSSTKDAPVFPKSFRMLFYADPVARKERRSWIESEVVALEWLRLNPHSNIATYHGAAVVRGRIVALVSERLPVSLNQRCNNQERPLDVGRVIRELHAALTHLHANDWCHNDVCPQNVMLRDDDTAVLMDFDSCLPTNKPLGKGMLLNKDATESSPANDWLGLELVEKHLRSFFPASA